MRLTPLDIRKQEFKKGMRGLDSDEVYAFLNTVADEYEAVLNDNKALRERLLELDDKVQEYRNMEKTLRDTLVTAERVTEEAKEAARREADLIIKKAEIEADRGARTITENATRLRQEIQMLRRQRDTYVARMKALLQSYLSFVEGAERDFALDDEQESSIQATPPPTRPAAAGPIEGRNAGDAKPDKGPGTPSTGTPGPRIQAAPPDSRGTTSELQSERSTHPHRGTRASESKGGTADSGSTLSAILDRMAEQDAKHAEASTADPHAAARATRGLGPQPSEPLAEKLPSDALEEGERGDMLIDDAEQNLWSLDRLKRDILGQTDEDGDR